MSPTDNFHQNHQGYLIKLHIYGLPFSTSEYELILYLIRTITESKICFFILSNIYIAVIMGQVLFYETCI